MKGIILAGGSGTRLYPSTYIVCKQLLPIYDKPMIYYPLSVLMLCNIREILIISTPHDIPFFKRIFKDGSQLGLQISYAVQESPKGIAEAFIIGQDFIKDDSVTLILGDNIFYGVNIGEVLNRESSFNAKVFAYYVSDPSAYGVVEFDKNYKVMSIEEKPKNPKSNYAVTGIYMYDNSVLEYVKKIKPSSRGELEITSLNELFLKEDKLKVEILGRGFAWLDTGTHESMLDASNFVANIEKRQGLKIASIEEIAYRKGYINLDQLIKLTNELGKSSYGQYLLELIERDFK